MNSPFVPCSRAGTPPLTRRRRFVLAALAVVASLTVSILAFSPPADASDFLPYPDAPPSLRCLKFDHPEIGKTFLYWGETQYPVAVFDDGRWLETVPDRSYTMIDFSFRAVVEIATWISSTGLVAATCFDPLNPPPSTDGVNLFSAGTGTLDAPIGVCDGEEGADPAALTVFLSQQKFLHFGASAAQVVNVAPGGSGESGPVPMVDQTAAKMATGLANFEAFGLRGPADPDNSVASLGTGGSVTIELTDRNGDPAMVKADGHKAEGEIGQTTTQVRADLDGHEILIFENNELSGMEISLHSTFIGQAPYVISVDDLERNPATPGGADDSLIAIDLDSLPGDAPFSVYRITITDDGVSRSGRVTCDLSQAPNLAQTAVELDAVVAIEDHVSELVFAIE